MKKETYVKMTRPFREHAKMAQGLHIANKLCTLTMYLAYPLLIGYMLFVQKDASVARMIIVPANSFVLVSAFRYLVNRPRPYEAFGVSSVIAKDTKGKSFPSRHVFSAMIIALTFLWASPFPGLGLVFVIVSLLLAVVRVVSGVHYISDVLAGIIAAVVAGVIGYVL